MKPFEDDTDIDVASLDAALGRDGSQRASGYFQATLYVGDQPIASGKGKLSAQQGIVDFWPADLTLLQNTPDVPSTLRKTDKSTLEVAKCHYDPSRPTYWQLTLAD